MKKVIKEMIQLLQKIVIDSVKYAMLKHLRLFTVKKISKRQIAHFCGQLKMLLSAGVPLVPALNIVQRLSPQLKLADLIKRINEGQSLAQALSRSFPVMLVSALQGAEQAGNLEEVLLRLSLHYETQADLEDRLKSAMIYPAFVMILCLLSVIFLLVFVLPSFRGLLLDFGAELPLFTRLLLSTGQFVNQTWYLPVFGCCGLVAVLSRFKRTEQGRKKLDHLLLKMNFYRKSLLSQLARTLGELLQGGVPLLQALDTSLASLNNSYLRQIVQQVKTGVAAGQKFSLALAAQPLLAKELVEMVEIGENSGQLAELLKSTADLYDREREQALKRLTVLLEPMMTLAVGLVVGLIALAMFLPLTNMISQIQ